MYSLGEVETRRQRTALWQPKKTCTQAGRAVQACTPAVYSLGEVEEWRQRAAVGQPRAGLAQLVEEAVRAGLQRGQARARRVLQQT